MFDDFLSRKIRAANRNLLLVGVGLAISLIAVCIHWKRDVRNYVLGPFRVSATELASYSSAGTATNYFVRVGGKGAFRSGIEDYPLNGDHSRILATYFFVPQGERLLMVRSEEAMPASEYTGTLVRMSADLRAALAELDKDKAGIEAKIYPFVLDTQQSPRDDWQIGFAGVVYLVLALAALSVGLYRVIFPERHPAWKVLARYGGASAAMGLESELKQERASEFCKGMHLTQNWLLYVSAFSVRVARLKDVVWAYPHVTKHYHTGIPTGKTYKIIVRDRTGQSIDIQIRKKDGTDKALQALQSRAPWAVIGYTKELDAQWRKQRAELISAVDKRMAGAAPAR